MKLKVKGVNKLVISFSNDGIDININTFFNVGRLGCASEYD